MKTLNTWIDNDQADMRNEAHLMDAVQIRKRVLFNRHLWHEDVDDVEASAKIIQFIF